MPDDDFSIIRLEKHPTKDITDNHENVCSIKVADCMPIFFGHCTIPVFGVIHVGWRGLQME